jgi:hypothetical protein
MTPDTLQTFFLYSFLINYGLLFYWFAMFVFAHDWMYKLHSKWFSIPPDAYDAIHFKAMAYFKLLVIVFNLVPWLTLLIIN